MLSSNNFIMHCTKQVQGDHLTRIQTGYNNTLLNRLFTYNSVYDWERRNGNGLRNNVMCTNETGIFYYKMLEPEWIWATLKFSFGFSPAYTSLSLDVEYWMWYECYMYSHTSSVSIHNTTTLYHCAHLPSKLSIHL